MKNFHRKVDKYLNTEKIYLKYFIDLSNECMYARLTQLCPTLCDSKDCSPPGSSVHGISQVRIQQWVAISSSKDLPNPGIKPMSYFLCLLHWHEVPFFQKGIMQYFLKIKPGTYKHSKIIKNHIDRA